MKRISIIGPAGSGKSTLAVKLGQIYGLPVYHFDKIREKIDSVIETEEWIIDGNRKVLLEKRIQNSDLVIFLDFPLDFCKDSVKQRDNSKRPDNPVVCNLSDDEFVAFCLNTLDEWADGKGKVINSLAKKYKQKFIILKNRQEVDDFLKTVSAGVTGRRDKPVRDVL